METNLALTIIGSVLILLGIIYNVVPKLVNEKIMGQLPNEAVRISALFRVLLGGLAIAIGTIALYCSYLPTEHSGHLLISMGLGFLVVTLTIILGKLGGLDDEIPIPPIILFTLLTILASSSSRLKSYL